MITNQHYSRFLVVIPPTPLRKILDSFFPAIIELSAFLLLLILCRAASSAAYSHTGDLEWEVESTSDTFQCGLVGYFTSPGIGTGQIEGTNGF